MGFDAAHGGIAALLPKLQALPYYPELFTFAFGDSTVTEFQVNELPEETKYYFRVASVGKSGQSDWSKAVVQISSGKRGPHVFHRRLARAADGAVGFTGPCRSSTCVTQGWRGYLLPLSRVR